MTTIRRQIGSLVFALSASCAAAQSPKPGDAVLALAVNDYAIATESMVRDRLQVLMDHLQVDVHTRARYLVNVAAAPVAAQAAPRLDKAEKMLKRSQATMAVIVAKNDVVLDHATDTVVIAGGHVKIGFATNALVVAGGSIVISHDGPRGSPGGMYVTRDRVEISHASTPIVYALRGASFSHFSRVTAYNTDVQGGYGTVTRLTRPPIFVGEYARRPASDSVAVNSGGGASPGFAYTGSRCERAVSEQSIEQLVRQAESKHGCTSIESVNVVCVSNGGPGNPSVERWTVRLCGNNEVYEARKTGGTPGPGQVGSASASITPLTPGPGMSALGDGSRTYPFCDNPQGDAEVSACIEAELRQGDLRINLRYQELMGKLSDEGKHELRADQRGWIKRRDSSCGSTSNESSRESWFQSLLKDYRKTVCIVRFTRTRVTYFENRLTAQSSPVAAQSLQYPRSAMAPASAENEDQYEIRAQHGHSRGRWYFEVKVAAGEIAKKVETTVQMGFSTPGLTVGRLLNLRKRDSETPTVRLGFALDLDNGKYYAHTNGVWRNGSPGSAGGIDVKLGREYRAVISSSTPLSELVDEGLINLNFGQRSFDYAMPAGYRPVAER